MHIFFIEENLSIILLKLLPKKLKNDNSYNRKIIDDFGRKNTE